MRLTLAKVMSVIMKPMMKSVGKLFARDLEDLRAALERRPDRARGVASG